MWRGDLFSVPVPWDVFPQIHLTTGGRADMHEVMSLLARAESAGVQLQLDNGRLRCFAPGGWMEAELRRALSENKLAVIQALREADDPARGPLAPGQEALFFEYLLDPDALDYNMDIAIELGALPDPELLTDTLRRLVERHPSLRTVFTDDEEPEQIVQPAGDVRLEHYRLRDRGPHPFPDAARRPFDLQHGPPVRFATVEYESGDRALLLSAHHIVADAISLAVMLNEALAIYQALAEGREPLLPAAGADYVSYARRQAKWARTPACAAGLQHALRCFEPAPPPLSPFSAKAPALSPAGPAPPPLRIDAAGLARIDRRARRAGTSRSELLLTTFARAACRCFDRDELVLALMVSTRNSPDLARTVGYFINAVPIRLGAPLLGNPDAALADTSRRCREALARMDVPFARVRSSLRRGGGTAEPIQISFNYVGLDFATPRNSALPVGAAHGVGRTVVFGLDVQLQIDGAGLRATVAHDPAQFDASVLPQLDRLWREELDRFTAPACRSDAVDSD